MFAAFNVLRLSWQWGLLAVAAVFLLALGILLLHFGMIYLRALFSGAKVTFTELLALRLRRIPVALVVDNRIAAVRSGVPLSIDDLSTHHLAGGNVPMVVLSLIAARKAGIHLAFDRACAIDLATKGTGKTVLEALDLAEVDVGDNVGAKLPAEQAEANKLIAQAHAEIRRAAAVAVEQEMTARVAEMRARVVEAQSMVPVAMAGAFRAGNLHMC